MFLHRKCSVLIDFDYYFIMNELFYVIQSASKINIDLKPIAVKLEQKNLRIRV